MSGQNVADQQTFLGFADTWWDFARLRNRFEDALLAVLDNKDFDKIWSDDYDGSIEIGQADNDIRLSAKAQQFLYDAGYAKCYVNHKDGWQTHYSWNHSEGFKKARGWRRARDGDCWLISYLPKAWTSGKIKYRIVPDPLEASTTGYISDQDEPTETPTTA